MTSSSSDDDAPSGDEQPAAYSDDCASTDEDAPSSRLRRFPPCPKAESAVAVYDTLKRDHK